MTSPAQPKQPTGSQPSSLNVPNALTAFRLVLVPVFAIVLFSHPHDPIWRVVSALIFVVAIFTMVCVLSYLWGKPRAVLHPLPARAQPASPPTLGKDQEARSDLSVSRRS